MKTKNEKDWKETNEDQNKEEGEKSQNWREDPRADKE